MNKFEEKLKGWFGTVHYEIIYNHEDVYVVKSCGQLYIFRVFSIGENVELSQDKLFRLEELATSSFCKETVKNT